MPMNKKTDIRSIGMLKKKNASRGVSLWCCLMMVYFIGNASYANAKDNSEELTMFDDLFEDKPSHKAEKKETVHPNPKSDRDDSEHSKAGSPPIKKEKHKSDKKQKKKTADEKGKEKKTPPPEPQSGKDVIEAYFKKNEEILIILNKKRKGLLESLNKVTDQLKEVYEMSKNEREGLIKLLTDEKKERESNIKDVTDIDKKLEALTKDSEKFDKRLNDENAKTQPGKDKKKDEKSPVTAEKPASKATEKAEAPKPAEPRKRSLASLADEIKQNPVYQNTHKE